MSIHEPRRTTGDIRRLRTKVAEDASFASLVFDVKETLFTHDASPNLMRAALRLVLHDEAWRAYNRTQGDMLFEEEDVEEEDGLDLSDLLGC